MNTCNGWNSFFSYLGHINTIVKSRWTAACSISLDSKAPSKNQMDKFSLILPQLKMCSKVSLSVCTKDTAILFLCESCILVPCCALLLSGLVQGLYYHSTILSSIPRTLILRKTRSLRIKWWEVIQSGIIPVFLYNTAFYPGHFFPIQTISMQTQLVTFIYSSLV